MIAVSSCKTVLGAFLVFVSIQAALSLSVVKQKPSFLRSCKFSDPQIEKCLAQDIENMIRSLANGSAELGLKPLDPMVIEEVKMTQGEGPVKLDFTMNNLKIKGLKNIKVLYNSVDPKTYAFHTKALVKQAFLEGNYVADGRVLLLPINGHGECFFECNDIMLDISCDVDLIKRKRHYFYDIKTMDIKYSMGQLKMELTNLFKNKELNKGTNDFFNSNNAEIIDALRPVLIDTIKSILFSVYRQIFTHTPAEYFIIDIK